MAKEREILSTVLVTMEIFPTSESPKSSEPGVLSWKDHERGRTRTGF